LGTFVCGSDTLCSDVGKTRCSAIAGRPRCRVH